MATTKILHGLLDLPALTQALPALETGSAGAFDYSAANDGEFRGVVQAAMTGLGLAYKLTHVEASTIARRHVRLCGRGGEQLAAFSWWQMMREDAQRVARTPLSLLGGAR